LWCGRLGERGEGTVWPQEAATKRIVSRQNSDAEFLRNRVGADPEVITKHDVLLGVCEHAMNDSILTGEGL
jgi:hypothetical protein